MHHGKKVFSRSIMVLALTGAALFPAGCGRKKPVNANELLDSALAMAMNGNRDQAMKQLSRILDSDPHNVAALLMLGLCQENSGQAEAAQQTFKKAVDAEPTNPVALYHLGRIQFQQKRYDDCLASLREAEKLVPNDEDIQVLLAQIEEKLKLPSSVEYYKKLAAGTKYRNRAGIWNQLGIFYAEKKDNMNAVKCFLQAYRLSPEDHTVCLNLAIFLDRYLNSASSRSKSIMFYKKYLALSKLNPEFKSQRDKVSARIKELAKL